jgi:anti-sigma regulatory factor (Ser/Thr protein kinase)
MSATQFAHEALLYEGEEGFFEATLPFVREGIEAEEPVLLVLDTPKIERIRDELDRDRERVHFADMSEVGANPARIIPTWRQFLDEQGGGRSVRGVGEPIGGDRKPDELVECQRHEELLNLAFADTPGFRLLCPYDTSVLSEAVIDEAVRSHPFVVEEGIRRPSASYRGLHAIAAPFADPLPAPPASVQELRFDLDSLSAVRHLVATRALDAGLGSDRRSDLVLAVNEIATNSVRHGGGTGTLRVWMGTRWLVCEIEDRGRLDDPLAGRRPPSVEQQDGRGLWIANQVCDLVQVRTFEAGTVVRLHLQRA